MFVTTLSEGMLPCMLSLLLLASPALAAPASSATAQSMSIPLDRSKQHVTYNREGLLRELDRVKRKYATQWEVYDSGSQGGSSTSAQSTAHLDSDAVPQGDAAAPASVPLTEYNALIWYGPVSLGTPAQGPVQLDFDTGSPLTVVYEQAFTPKKSTSATDTGKKFKIEYADGTISTGKLWKDTLTVGGLAVKDQVFGVSTTPLFEGIPDATGLVGMSFSDKSNNSKPLPLFYNLVAQGLVKEDVFGFNLQGDHPRLDLGGVDHSAFKGELKYAPVDNSQGMWSVQAKANGVELGGSVVDTGTTLIVGSKEVISKACIDGGGEVEPRDPKHPKNSDILCAFKKDTPLKVIINVGGVDYTLSQESLHIGEDAGIVYAGLTGTQEGTTLYDAVLGDVFLQNVYSSFVGTTGDSPKVGFAELAT